MSFGYVQCHNTWEPANVNTNILKEINDAMADHDPIRSILSLTIVENWKITSNPFWLRAWIELNKDEYTTARPFADDMVEVFGL